MPSRALVACVVLCVASVASAAENSTVRVPLDQWQQMVDGVRELERPPEPEHPFAVVRRSVDVAFARGVLTGSMDAEIDVDTIDRTVTVPLLDLEASLSSITVDGAAAVATRADGMNAVLIAKSGRHRVHLTFAKGQDEDRFTRGFSLMLPPGPVTRVVAMLPEADVEAELDGGVIMSQSRGGTGTRLEAAMGASGELALHWRRKAAEASAAKRELEARMFVLASVHEQTVRTRTTIAYRLLSGEASRFELAVPEGVEVTGVTGDAVLQWTAERRGDQRVVAVLLKYLVDDAASIEVATQHPRGSGGVADLKLVRAIDAALREGFIALEGRAGFELVVTKNDDAVAMPTGDLPSELLAATDKPLLAAFRFEKEPKVAVTVTRNEQVELTQAVIDDLEAVTLVGEDGVEIVKLKLFVRNNTRQYLGVSLPADSHVTHALIDGSPIQPATTVQDGAEMLLVPLRQSEKVAQRGRRMYTIQRGDTLGGIALRLFNRTDRADEIAAANGNLRADQLQVGQRLIIPSGGSAVQESSFVVELAYETRRNGLGSFGRRALTLPALDIAVMAVHWSAYLPDAYEPLRFATDLRQLDALRYDPLTRLRYYIDNGLAMRSAWAGGSSSYENVLRSRKMIYEKEQKKQVKVALTSFPLVGERYRFSRVLLGKTQAQLDVSYVRRSVQPWLRGVAAVCVVLALWAWLARSREQHGLAWRHRDFGVLAAVLFLAAVLGHYVLGVHRSVVLALDVGLLAFLVFDIWRHWSPLPGGGHITMVYKRGFKGGRWLLRFVAVVALAYVLAMFPMFWSLIALAILSVCVARRMGVRHA